MAKVQSTHHCAPQGTEPHVGPRPGAGKSQQRLALRARIVFLAVGGLSNAAIAVQLGVCVDTGRKWRCRWAANPGVTSLTTAKRSGRPAVFTAVQVTQVTLVKPLACQPLSTVGVALSRWSCLELARQAFGGSVWPRSRCPRCAAGWPRTRSNPGSTSHGCYPRPQLHGESATGPRSLRPEGRLPR